MSTVRKFTAAFPGKYIQGEHAITALPGIIQLLGKKGLIIASPTVKSKILPVSRLEDSDVSFSTEVFKGECCETELKRIQETVVNRQTDIIIGMGGGKTIDTAKIVADRAGLPVIIVPTIASTDAPCSGCAVIYSEEGEFESVYYTKMNPQVVLVDTYIIANAPVRFLVAGMGDALATWFEARSCAQTQSFNECGGLSTMTGLNLARLCYDTLLKYGSEARHSCEQNIVSPALEHITEANILLSGIGFESSGLATAHSVHNGLSALEETHAYYHGEKVAFGILTGLHLTSAASEEIETVYSFCETIGLPTTFSDIGIKEANHKMLMKVAVKTCAPTEGIHHEIVQVTTAKVIEAMIAADELGRTRKKERGRK
ncbi:MAG: glycerol dehydrogenase [Bacteroidota bacterium]|nr:glycerol dehydrogenase [Bacteroidota bacterium]